MYLVKDINSNKINYNFCTHLYVSKGDLNTIFASSFQKYTHNNVFFYRMFVCNIVSYYFTQSSYISFKTLFSRFHTLCTLHIHPLLYLILNHSCFCFIYSFIHSLEQNFSAALQVKANIHFDK